MPNQDELREVDQREASDCHRACIATIFGIPWEDAPATAPPPGYDEKKDRWWSQPNVINDWLAARGLVEWRIEAKPEDRPVLRRGMRIVGPEKRREPADFMWPFPMATYYIGSGRGPRGVEHSVVMHRGKIVHDPNPARDLTIDAITSIGVFVARLPPAASPTAEAEGHADGTQVGRVIDAVAKAINDELRRKGRTFSLPPDRKLALAALAAAPREDEGLREALKSLADWVEYGLDLSDEYSLEGAADELVNCRRPVRVWVDGQERLDVARARLAASPVASREDEGEGS